MSLPSVVWAAASAALVAAAVASILVRRAPRAWSDDGAEERERKLQQRPVPLVLGTALAAGCAAGWGLSSMLDGPAPGPRVAAALAAAWLLGLVDDLAPRGLGPAVKFAGQCAVALLWAAEPGAAPAELALRTAAALAAMNAANTFDNADGALLACCGVPLLALGAPAGAAAAALLPWNLARGGARAYLGDSGSHLLGLVLLVAHPLAWTLLCLPVFDLALVVGERMRAGQAPWRGDRRHLAHRLQRRGWSRHAVAAVLCALAVAPLAGAALAGDQGLAGGALVCAAGALACWILGRAQPA